MPTIGRYFGFVAAPTVGGTPRVHKGATPRDRNDEMRGVRGNPVPLPFRQAPTVTIAGNLYPGLAKKLIALWTGATDVRSGTAPAATTHRFEPVQAGPQGLKAIHIAGYRDGLYEKIAGCQLSEFTFTFPNDDDATFEATFQGLYRVPVLTPYPAVPAFNDVSDEWVMVARDAKVFLDGQATPAPRIRSFSLSGNNGFRDPDFDAGLNVEAITEGGEKTYLWWPNARRLGSAQNLTGNLEFADVQAGQDRRHDLQRAQKIVFECSAGDLATTPPVRELMRATLWKTVYTGGGVGAATREDDIQTSFEYSAGIDPQNANRDLTVEFVDANPAAITV